MKICVIGTGYVGLVTGTCLANFGHEVICVDKDQKKLKVLRKGLSPIYERGLEKLIKANLDAGRLVFTDDLANTVKECKAIFIAVGTPSSDDGSADLSQVKAVSMEIGQALNEYKVIIDKSTVPVGTGKLVTGIIKENLTKDVDFDVVSNPEFLREGTAVNDFMMTDRVVIGTESDKAKDVMRKIYTNMIDRNIPLLFTGLESAEMIKYASNAFLAVKISFINEIANLCENVGANVKEVAVGMGMDKRIGNKFLFPGPGFGGSCFPKDTKAILKIAEENDRDLQVIQAAVKANYAQHELMIEKLNKKLTDRNMDLVNKTIALWGLAFKKNTDDTRDSPAIYIAKKLAEKGVKIRAFDPQAFELSKIDLKKFSNIEYCESEMDAVKGADVLMILTEWEEFRTVDMAKVKNVMTNNILIDARNMLHPDEMVKLGYDYDSVGRPIK